MKEERKITKSCVSCGEDGHTYLECKKVPFIGLVAETFGLPTNLNNSNKTTNPRCQQGHSWTYGGSIGLNLEGMPCDCGEVLFHTEKCPCCNQTVSKHLPNPNNS